MGTGGTIAGQASSQGEGVGYKAAQISIEGLLQAIPDLQAQAGGCVLEAAQLAQIDSKDMDWAVWRTLLRSLAELLADACTRAVVVTHGTDTLEETAWLLQAVLQPAKPVVLTCAMRPATALQADGPQNLRDAVAAAAQAGGAGIAGAGVWVMAAGALHPGLSVQKAHPYRLDALRSYESGPSAYMEEGVLRWVGRPAGTGSAESADKRLAQWLSRDALPWVEIVTSGAAQSARAVQALVAAGVQGLVVAGTGNATVHAQMLDALLEARKAGVRVWCSTRCPEGVPVLPASAASTGCEHWLDGWLVPAEAQAEAVGEALAVIKLPPAKARLAMMLDLALPPA
ncbi:L-asparaginase [Comamonas phosphati]|nr:L-asparaginase [Comamonas phosphati]